MKRNVEAIVFIFALALPAILKAQTAAPTVDYQAQIQKLQEEMNQLELQTEKTQSQQTQGGQKSLVNLTGGSLEQDFESNSNNWTILQGQTLHLNFAANPLPNATGTFDLMFLGKVAPDILHYSYLPTLAQDNVFVLLRKAEIDFETPYLSMRAFTGMPHDSFYNDGDLYYLFPAQQDVDTPFRISGRAVPTGMELKGKQDLDGLDIWAGYELIWGVGQEVVAKYQHNIEGVTVGLIDKVYLQSLSDNAQGVTYAPAVTITTNELYKNNPTSEAEFFVRVPFPNAFSVDGVVLYNPISANQAYTYVQNVAPGTGTNGTAYQLYTGTTNNTTDALGYQVKLTTNSIPYINSLMLNGEYSGIIAGDLERISGEITEIPAPSWLITLNGTVQKPLFGPNPLVYYGTSSSSLGTMIQPRSQYDPFRVTMDPISGINNREMTKFSASFLYNTGNGWFFKYNPNVFDSYNINMNLDTDFSFGLIGTVFNYPTATDLTSYVDGSGNLVWESPGSLGQPATNGYLPFVHGIGMWKTDDLHWILDLSGGYSTASLGQSSATRSSTDLFSGTMTWWMHDTSFGITYGRDVWGPESWDVQFGTTIGQLYVAQLTQKFGTSSASVKYERWDNLSGDPYQYPIVNGATLPIDEVYVTYMLNF